MAKLSAAQAADELRGEVNLEAQSMIPPEDQHKLKFLREVCGHLAIAPGEANMHRVEQLLRDRGIDMDFGNEYPKHVKNYAGERVVVYNAADEEAAGREPAEGDPAYPKPLGEGLPEGALVVKEDNQNVADSVIHPTAPPYEPGAQRTELGDDRGAAGTDHDPAPRSRPTSDVQPSYPKGTGPGLPSQPLVDRADAPNVEDRQQQAHRPVK